jgi:Ca2+-binding EF-hand superfamily protein
MATTVKKGIAFDAPSSAGSRGSEHRQSSASRMSPSRRQSTIGTSPSSSARTREISVVGSGRRSISVSRYEDLLRPVTQDDISMAFSLLSKDGRRITKEDIKQAFEKYFPNCPSKVLKILQTGKEDVSKEALHIMLISRMCPTDYFEDAFQVPRSPKIYTDFFFVVQTITLRLLRVLQVFEPNDEGFITDSTLNRLIKEINTYKMPYKNDLEAIKQKFDKDKDGMVNVEDFKKMNMRQFF